MRWIHKFRTKFRRSIQIRLTCYFILILLPLIGLSLFANFQSRRILEEELAERTINALGSALEYVDLTMGGLEELSTLISTDVNLTSRLNHEESELTPDALIDFTKVKEQISNITAVNQILSETMIFHSPTGLLLSTKMGALHRDGYLQETWYQEAVRAGGGVAYVLPERDAYHKNGLPDQLDHREQVLLVRLMDLYNKDRGNNVLILSVQKSKLRGYVENLAPSRSSQYYLFDDRERLIVSNAPAGQAVPVWDAPDRNRIVREAPETSERMLMLRVVSPDTGWSLMLVQPEREIYQKSKPLQIFSFAIILISCLLAVWISWLVYSGIAAPIVSLAEGMRQLRMGNLDAKLVNRREDELGYLTDAFNQTAEQQRHLIRDIYEQQLRLTKTELKFLQSQINPHFLYNTLDSIYWKAKNYDAEEVSDMVLNLSRFFRLSLKKGQELFTVDETFTHLQYYINIQQHRFVGQFTVDFRVSEESRGLYVLKLILQPLVENAILHGLEKKKGGGKLIVSADVRKDHLVLQVTDNGKGIPAEEMVHIQKALALAGNTDAYRGSEEHREYYGLLNVKSRIKIYYGEDAEFLLDSMEGKGTTATIMLPLKRCKQSWEEDDWHELDDRRG